LLQRFSFADLQAIFVTEPTLAHVSFITGNRELTVKNGGSFSINYRDGLQLNRIVLQGFYRLFPPDGLKAEITSAGVRSENFGAR